MRIRSQKGFSIAEMLIVLGIIGILTTIVMVNFRRGEDANALRQGGIELQQDLRLAQSYSTSGKTLDYCDIESDFAYEPCDQDADCESGELLDTCKREVVPVGGFAFSINSTSGYRIQSDNQGDQAIDGVAEEVIVSKDFSEGPLSIPQFKLGDTDPVVPAPANTLDIFFDPPEGVANIYLNGTRARDNEVLATTVQFLVQSDRVDGSCRIVTLNRISGQISETDGPCSL